MGYCISSTQKCPSKSMELSNNDLVNLNIDDNTNEEFQNFQSCNSPNTNFSFSGPNTPIFNKLLKFKTKSQFIRKSTNIN